MPDDVSEARSGPVRWRRESNVIWEQNLLKKAKRKCLAIIKQDTAINDLRTILENCAKNSASH